MNIIKFFKISLGITLIYSASTLAYNDVYINYLSQTKNISYQAAKDKIQKQREQFIQAKEAILDGRLIEASHIKNAYLKDYPLNIWLDYYYLSRNISNETFNEGLTFIKSNKHHELGALLKQRYINFFAKQKDFKKVATILDKKPFEHTNNLNFTQKALMCRFYEANWHVNKASTEAVSYATSLYLSLKNKPQACNGLMALLDTNGYITDALKVKKIEKAYIEKDYKSSLLSLVNSLKDNNLKQRAIAYMALYEEPQNLFDVIKNNSASNRRVAVLVFKRLANTDTQKAVTLLKDFIKRYKPSDVETIDIYKIIATNLLDRNASLEDIKWVDDNLPVIAWSEFIQTQRLRRAIYHSQWKVVDVLIDNLNSYEKNQVNWRYFKARAQKELGQVQQANELFIKLAKDRSFYGFLAAQSINYPMSYNHIKLKKGLKFPQDIYKSQASLRYFELEALGDDNAIYEWREVAKYGTHDEALLMAQWALDNNKFNLAIDTVISAKRWDYLDYRFPIAYEDIYKANSKEFNIPLSFIYGVSRQESMLNATIKSHAGAVGLMQLMPATAKQMARKHKAKYKNSRDLVDPKLNVFLGTAYLKYLMNKFDNNRILVAVGYNAGPGRAINWASKDGKTRDVAQYVENIPFKETRQYVQNVILYDAIYYKLIYNKEKPLLNKQEFNYKY